MIDEKTLEVFSQRYSHIHLLLFWRSVEKAKTPGELFDILEGMPSDFPLIWDEDRHCWKITGHFPI